MDSIPNSDAQSPAPAWGLKQVLWAVPISLLLFVGIIVVAVVVELTLRTAPSAVYVRGALVALAELAFVVPVWLFAVRRPGVGWRGVGLRSFRPLVGCLAPIGLLYVTLSVNLIWGLVLQLLGWAGQPDVQPLFGEGPLGLVVAILGTCIVAPMAEELFFRGFVFPPLRLRLGRWLAIVVSAALFTLPHFTPTVFPPIFALGIFFGILYEFTGSLWPGIMLHASVNTLAVLATYLLPR